MGKTSHTRVLVHKSNSMPGWIPSQKTSECKCTQVRFSKTTIVTTRDSIVEYDNCDDTLKVHWFSILLCPGCPASDDPVTSSRDGRSSVVSSSLEKRRLLMRKIWCQVKKSKFWGFESLWGQWFVLLFSYTYLAIIWYQVQELALTVLAKSEMTVEDS